MVKLVVDIPEELYKTVKEKEYCHTDTVDLVALFTAVKHSEPLLPCDDCFERNIDFFKKKLLGSD